MIEKTTFSKKELQIELNKKYGIKVEKIEKINKGTANIFKIISNNEKYNSLLSQIEELRKIGISFQNQSSKTTFNEMLENLTCASTNIFVYYNTYETILNSLKRTNNENYINIANLIEEAINFLQSLYNNFPNFIFSIHFFFSCNITNIFFFVLY